MHFTLRTCIFSCASGRARTAEVSADRMVDFRSAWMREHPAEAKAIETVPFDCDNITRAPPVPTAARARSAQHDPPPPPTPPEAVSEDNLPAVVSDDSRRVLLYDAINFQFINRHDESMQFLMSFPVKNRKSSPQFAEIEFLQNFRKINLRKIYEYTSLS